MSLTGEVMELLDMYEDLFLNENKDVTFKLADGEERAHKLILSAASEVFEGMFKQEMREKADGVVQLPHVKRLAMRVFLRLVYTGHVNPIDWASEHAEQDASKPACLKPLKQSNVTIDGQRVTATRGCWNSYVIVKHAEEDLEYSVRFTGHPPRSIMIGIAPLQAAPGQRNSLYDSCGFYIHLFLGALSFLFGQDGTCGKELPSPVPVPAGAEVKLKYNAAAKFSFSVNSSPFQFVDFNTNIPGGIAYCPAVNLCKSGDSIEIQLESSTAGGACPHDTLLSVACLAKKYMVRRVLSSATQVLKTRLRAASASGSVEPFEQIFSAAIAEDISALRMAALEEAKSFPKLREAYDAQKLQPEVAYELEAIWPSPSGRSKKRSRLQMLS